MSYFDDNVRTVLSQSPQPTTAEELARTLWTRVELVDAALARLLEQGAVARTGGQRWSALESPPRADTAARAHAERDGELDRLRRELARVRSERDRLAAELQAVRSARAPVPRLRPGEVEGWLEDLLVLCHPDRHNDSERATRVTQWLLSRRRR